MQAILAIFSGIKNRYFLFVFAIIAVTDIFLLLGIELPLSGNFAVNLFISAFILNFFSKNGTYLRTKLFSFNYPFLSMAIIGMLCKIMHYPYGSELLTISFLGILIIYLIHFLRKNPKGVTDILKLTYFAFLIVIRLVKLSKQFAIPEMVYFIPELLLFITVSSMVYDNKSNKIWLDQ